MSDRLSALDASFLYLEESTTPMHVGSVMVFDPGPGRPDHEALRRHVAARVALVPRYRQRVRPVPFNLGTPVWVDDERFDITYHVRRSALPSPGTEDQLAELVARLQSRRLDRTRPLWELFVVEGLEGGRFAVVTKVHQALVDGVHAVDLGQVVLDRTPQPAERPPHMWHPGSEPTDVELMVSAVADTVRRPARLVETLTSNAGDLRATAGKVLRVAGAAVPVLARPTPRSPLNVDITHQRRVLVLETALDTYRQVRDHANVEALAARGRGDDRVLTSVNDVVLAALAGGLRTWLLTRGLPTEPGQVVRALVPMSLRSSPAGEAEALGGRVASLLVDLPVGEPSPLMRLYQVAFQLRAHTDSGRAVDAPALAGIAGFAPPTLHSLGARVASGLSSRLFNLVVTNVPGPQTPLYLCGARMVASHPVIPLAKAQALAVGVTSYDGGVCFGFNADRDALPDLDVLGQCVLEALTELREAIP